MARTDAGATRLAHRGIAAGIALRTGYLIVHPPVDHVTSDMAEFVQRAARLAGGGHLPPADFFFPVGTQLLISLPMRVLGTGRQGLWAASILWWVLSCAFPWFAWKWAGTLLSPRAAAICAVGCALSPLAIIYGGYFSSELPALALLPAALWLLAVTIRRRSWRLGVASGAVALLLLTVRQQFALNLALAAVIAWTALRPRLARVSAALAAGAVLAIAAVIALGAPPWRYSGHVPPVFGDNGGANFFYGHCDAHILTAADLFFENPVRALSHTGHDISVKPHLGSDQGWFYAHGIDCITNAPGRAVVLAARSALDMTATTKPFPPVTEGGLVEAIAIAANAGFCALLVVLAIAVLRRGRRQRVPLTLLAHLALAFVVAVVFLGEPRYRIPYDLFGWALLGWWIDRRSTARPSTGWQEDFERRAR